MTTARMFGRGFLMAAGLVVGTTAVAQAQDMAPVTDDADQFITFTSENDKFGTKSIDRHYTNGARVKYTRVTDEAPNWVQAIGDKLPGLELGGKTAVSYGVNHAIFTPDNVQNWAPSPGDMPYSGYLFGTVGVSDIQTDRTDEYELTVGTIGPSAQGKFVQRAYHDVTGLYKPNGWDAYHLKDEPILNVSWLRRHQGLYAADIDAFGKDWFFDVEPRYGFALGNAYTHATTGATVRFGPASAQNQDTVGYIVPGMPGNATFGKSEDWFTWFLFASADGRVVGRNIFLDGNTFQSSPHVDKERFVADLATGLAVTTGKVRTTFALNQRTQEFKTQKGGNDVFGSISVGYRF